jgi:TamB, inner membrane protein subunit of TAM complex
VTPDEPSSSPNTSPLPGQTDSPPPAPHRRVFRWVIIITGVAAMMLLGLFTAQTWLTRIASRSIQGALGKELGLPVSMEGLSIQWFPAAVNLQQMRIDSPDQEPVPLLTTSSVQVQFSLLSLLADHIVIHRITVETPHLELNADRIERVSQSVRRPARPRGEAAPIIVSQIAIHHGTARYTDREQQVRAVLDQFGGTIDLGLLIERATITFTNGRMRLERGPWHQAFTSIGGRAIWTPSRLALKRLSVDGPEGHVILDGAVGLETPRSVQMTVKASLPLGQLEPWLPADHVWDGALGLETSITGLWTPEPGLWQMVAPLSFSGRLDINHLTIDALPIGTATTLWQLKQGRLALTRLTGALFNGSINGHVTASLPPAPHAIEAAFDLSGLIVGPSLRRFASLAAIPDGKLSGHLTVRGDGWTFGQLGGDGQLTVETMDTGDNDRPLSPASTAPPAPLRAALHRLSRITADGQWHADQLTIRRVEVVSRSGNQLTIQGTVAYRGPMALSGSWQWDDLSEMSDWAASAGFSDLAGWTGASAGTLTVVGNWDRPRLSGSLTVRALGHHGEFIDDGRVVFSYEAETLTWHDGHLRQGGGVATTSGSVTFPPTVLATGPPGRTATARAHVRGSIAVINGELGRILRLIDVSVPIEGRADGTFTLEGWSQTFHLRGPVHVAEGHLFGQPITRSDLAIDLTVNGIAFPRVALTEGKGVLQGSGRIDFDDTYQTTFTVERWSLESLPQLHAAVPQLSGTLSGSLSGSGSWTAPHAEGRIELSGLTAGASELGRGVVAFRLAGLQLDVTAELDNPRLSAKGTVQVRDDFPATLRWRVSQFPIALLLRPFIPAWPEQITLIASGEGELDGRFVGPPNLSGRLTLSTLTAQLVDYPIANDGPIELEIQNGRIEARRVRFAGEGTSVAVEGSLTPFERYDLFVHGEAEMAILRLFFSRVSYGKGKGYLALQISDQWLDPKIAGGISIQDGLIRVEAVDEPFTIAYAGLVFNGQQLVLDDLHGGIGKGTVQASGRITLHGMRPTEYRVLMEVGNMPISPIDGLSGMVDGALWLQGELTGGDADGIGRHLLKGDLQLVRATYSKRIDLKTILREQPTFDAVKLSLPSFLDNVALQLHLWGHHAIWIRNNIATLPLDIDLEARGTVEHPIIVGHVLTTGGTFTFLHTPFQVSQGSIDFLDPKQTRPVIDLKANATVRSYRIDLALSGTPERVQLDLSSDPVLSQADILSVMTVGRTSEEVSTAGTGTVATSEAASLLLGELIEEPAQQYVGIDRVMIESAVDRSGLLVGSQLTIGKSLLDNRLLFLYSYPLNPTTLPAYKLEYEVNRHISLIADGDESGRAGGDIKFRFDFR